MAAADSNVILRLLVQDDDRQYAAALAFLRASGRIFVSHVVLAEAAWGLLSVYEFPKSRVSEQFVVHDTPTRNDPLHRTVELPKPVTQRVSDLFNKIFGR